MVFIILFSNLISHCVVLRSVSTNKTYGFLPAERVLCCLGKVGRKRAQEKGITRKEKSLAQQVLLSETDAAVKNKQVHSRVRKLLDPKN